MHSVNVTASPEPTGPGGVGTPSTSANLDGAYPLVPYAVIPSMPFTSASAEEFSNFCDQHGVDRVDMRDVSTSRQTSDTNYVWQASIAAQAGPSSAFVGMLTSTPSTGDHRNQRQAREVADASGWEGTQPDTDSQNDRLVISSHEVSSYVSL